LSKMKLKDEPAIKKLAKDLKLGKVRNAEEAIREFCVQQIETLIKTFGEIKDLSTFLEIVSSSLGIRFEEVNNDSDIQRISESYVVNEPIFADLYRQLDSQTDAILIRLSNRGKWQPKYIAIIDCRNKRWRAFFSKWHEVAHVLTTPAQTSFQFRRTPALKKDPEEIIVDRIAGDLAFYSPLFLPELLARVKSEKRVTFEIIEDLRQTICPEASKEATIRASVSRSPFPQLLIIAEYGLKKDEERRLSSSQIDLFPRETTLFEPKLRAVMVTANKAALTAGLWIYQNMEVPQESVIFEALGDWSSTPATYIKIENLNWWSHSRGRLDDMDILVEAKKIGDRVFALVSIPN